MALRAFEGLVALLLIILVITQLVVPLWSGRKTFPLFRQRKPAEKRLIAATEALEDAELTRGAEALEHKAKGSAEAVAALSAAEPVPQLVAETPAPARSSRKTARRQN